jgi:NitT/TauT family transport system ATP-binding protein
VLENLSLDVADGGFTCIVGRSGCGKTTLLNLIAGLTQPDSGQIVFSDDGAAPRLGYVFQTPRLLNWKTVLGNVTFVLSGRPGECTDRKQKAEGAIEDVGLADWRNHYPWQLSEGMKTRVNIARALSIEPQILLMDEPFAHLDQFSAQELREELMELWHRQRITTVFVTHNIREAVWLADQVLILASKPVRMADRVTVTLRRPRTLVSPEMADLETEIMNKLK